MRYGARGRRFRASLPGGRRVRIGGAAQRQVAVAATPLGARRGKTAGYTASFVAALTEDNLRAGGGAAGRRPGGRPGGGPPPFGDGPPRPQ